MVENAKSSARPLPHGLVARIEATGEVYVVPFDQLMRFRAAELETDEGQAALDWFFADSANRRVEAALSIEERPIVRDAC